MNIQPGSLTAIGLLRNAPQGLTTAAGPVNPNIGKGGSTALSGDNTVKVDFTSFADMRSDMLKGLGTDENGLKSMSPQDRQAIEDKVRAQMQAAAEANAKGEYSPGRLADLKA